RSTRRPRSSESIFSASWRSGFSYLFRHHSHTFPAISSTPCRVAPLGYMPTADVRSSPHWTLLHLLESHSPGHGYSRFGSPPVAANCHSHSVGKRIFKPVRLLSHLQNATASNQETVSRGELASSQRGSRRLSFVISVHHASL